MTGTGSQTWVTPAGFSTSTRVVISNVRHAPGWGLKSLCCANAARGSAAASGSAAPVLRKMRRSMTVLLGDMGEGGEQRRRWAWRPTIHYRQRSARRREQTAQALLDRRRAPVELAERGVSDPLLRVDDHRVRQQARAPGPRDRAIAVEEHREVDRDPLEELADPGLALGHVHGEDHERAVVEPGL